VKILLMGFTKLKYMPYMNFYLDQIDAAKNDVHVLYWNRDEKDEARSSSSLKYHEFLCLQEDDVAKLKKVGSFLKYRKYALGVLRKEKFDFIFVLHSIPGVLITSYLVNQYENRFIFDYRDYTYEGFALFRNCVHKLVNSSFATFVSSDAFRKALPDTKKIYTSHNLLEDSLTYRNRNPVDKKEPVRIAYWGIIRHEELNKRIISSFANDQRFELHYYGREQAVALNLKLYAAEIGANNVFFHGEYKPEDRYDFSRQTDIIHNMFSNTEQPHMSLAMGNKYYDGLIFYLPQICTTGSFMGDTVKKANVGLACDPFQDDFADIVWDYYQRFDINAFYKNCDDELDRVLKEYKEGITTIIRAIEVNRM